MAWRGARGAGLLGAGGGGGGLFLLVLEGWRGEEDVKVRCYDREKDRS